MKKIIPISIFIVLCISCKKDKLKNEYSILEGKWNWNYTVHSFGWCGSAPQFETIDASTDPKTYQVEFLEKGKIWFYEDGEVVEKSRIVFDYFELLDNGEYHYYIKLDNKDEEIIGGSVQGDSLRIKYPYIESEPNCENYLNFFVRE